MTKQKRNGASAGLEDKLFFCSGDQTVKSMINNFFGCFHDIQEFALQSNVEILAVFTFTRN